MELQKKKKNTQTLEFSCRQIKNIKAIDIQN